MSKNNVNKTINNSKPASTGPKITTQTIKRDVSNSQPSSSPKKK